MPKAETAFSCHNAVYDTTIGWRFVDPVMKAQYGVDSMPETAENVATEFHIEREAQDRMALASQMKAMAVIQAGHLAREICTVSVPQKKGDALVVDTDEHPRATTLAALAKLKGVVRADRTVTAGNASGLNDGACALLLASEASAVRNGLTPKARTVAMATAGVAPRLMGTGRSAGPHPLGGQRPAKRWSEGAIFTPATRAVANCATKPAHASPP